MEIIRVNSFILKKLPIKEFDALVFLYTDSLGKVLAKAKSGFKKDTKWVSKIETMNLIDTALYKKRDYYYLTETVVIDSFIDIKRDLNKSLIALEVLDLIDKTQVENNPNINLFNKLKEFLDLLRKLENFYPLFISFIFNFLKIEGLQFPFDKCIKCGKELKDERIYDFNLNGFVCNSHKTNNYVELNEDLYNKIQIVSTDLNEVIDFDKDELQLVLKILSSFLEFNFSYKIKNSIQKILVYNLNNNF